MLPFPAFVVFASFVSFVAFVSFAAETVEGAPTDPTAPVPSPTRGAMTNAKPAAPKAASTPASKTAKPRPRIPAGFPALRDRYVKAFLNRYPVVATYLGAEGLDPALARAGARLRDLSPAGLRAERAEWMDIKAQLDRLDKKPLSEADAIDARVMEAQLAFLLRNLDRNLHERALDVTVVEPFRGVEWLLRSMTPAEAVSTGDPNATPAAAPALLGTKAEWDILAERLTAIPPYVKVAIQNMRRGATANGLPDRRLIRSTEDDSKKTAEYFEKELPATVQKAMPPSVPAEVKARVLAASAAAGTAYREFRQALIDLYFQGQSTLLRPEYDRDRFAIGDEEYTWALRNNLRIDKTPKELHAFGKKRVGETLVEMRALTQRVAKEKNFPSSEIGDVLLELSKDVPKDDAELLQSYRDTSRRLVDYGRQASLFEMPAGYTIDVASTPQPLRGTLTASYSPAPTFKKSGIGRFYVTPTGDDPLGLRLHPKALLATLAAHEGFPGHDYQGYFLKTRGTTISPVRSLTPGGVEESTSMWQDAMAMEGWALYAEQLVGEPRPGFPDGFYSLEERLFHLRERLFRAARVVVDTGIHTGFMRFDEAVYYFSKNVLFVKGEVTTDPAKNPDAAERAAVESVQKEIQRYAKWPTQAVTYFMGRTEILDLRAEVKAIEGNAFDEKRFHEELLGQGPIPPGYFREAVLRAARGRVKVE